MATGATDFDIATLRARRTNKWHKFPDDVLPAWVADMDFGVAPAIAEALARLARNQEYGYAAREGALAAAFARRMQRRFGWQTDPADTHPIGDLVQASFSSVMAFSDPGDAVLLQLPSYPPFMARDQRHRPPPDRQPHARQRHALGARSRRLRGRTRSARPRADLLPSAEPHRPRLHAARNSKRWRRSPSATT